MEYRNQRRESQNVLLYAASIYPSNRYFCFTQTNFCLSLARQAMELEAAATLVATTSSDVQVPGFNFFWHLNQSVYCMAYMYIYIWRKCVWVDILVYAHIYIQILVFAYLPSGSVPKFLHPLTSEVTNVDQKKDIAFAETLEVGHRPINGNMGLGKLYIWNIPSSSISISIIIYIVNIYSFYLGLRKCCFL